MFSNGCVNYQPCHACPWRSGDAPDQIDLQLFGAFGNNPGNPSGSCDECDQYGNATYTLTQPTGGMRIHNQDTDEWEIPTDSLLARDHQLRLGSLRWFESTYSVYNWCTYQYIVETGCTLSGPYGGSGSVFFFALVKPMIASDGFGFPWRARWVAAAGFLVKFPHFTGMHFADPVKGTWTVLHIARFEYKHPTQFWFHDCAGEYDLARIHTDRRGWNQGVCNDDWPTSAKLFVCA
jgi:hypothetical protein